MRQERATRHRARPERQRPRRRDSSVNAAAPSHDATSEPPEPQHARRHTRQTSRRSREAREAELLLRIERSGGCGFLGAARPGSGRVTADLDRLGAPADPDRRRPARDGRHPLDSRRLAAASTAPWDDVVGEQRSSSRCRRDRLMTDRSVLFAAIARLVRPRDRGSDSVASCSLVHG